MELPDRSGIESSDFEVWEDNWEALQLFLSCRTQWRMLVGASSVIYQGLDYQALHSVMDMRGIARKARAELFMCVQLIEAGALAIINNGK